MRVTNAYILALCGPKYIMIQSVFVATIDSPIQAAEYIEHKLNQLGFTRLLTLETMMAVHDNTLNNTYKCAHINGLISPLILVRSFSDFQQIYTTSV